MKVILLADVPNVGKKFETKDVPGGFARNFLFPRKLAEPATPSSEKAASEKKRLLEIKEEAYMKHLSDVVREIDKHQITFSLKGNEKHEPFGSVTKDMIARELRSKGFLAVERAHVKLAEPLKQFGTHAVEVHLKKGVSAKVAVILQPQS